MRQWHMQMPRKMNSILKRCARPQRKSTPILPIPKLAAAVTNAGGMGVLGGINYTPEMLKDQIDELKSHLTDKKAPFGVDLLLPQVGGNARKTK